MHLLLNKHPYADAMIADLTNFKTLTGMDVTYDVFPEDVYFDKVTAALSSKSSQYDAFMTGAYMTWTYGPAGWIDDLNAYIKDPTKTNPNYNWEDVLPGSSRLDGLEWRPGRRTRLPRRRSSGAFPGASSSTRPPITGKCTTRRASSRRRTFPNSSRQPPSSPRTLGGPYGIGVRGSRSWATIHPGFLSGYANYGQKDFTVDGGKLKAAMNTAVSKDFHKMFVKMIQDSGPKNWSTYTWYQVGTDLGAGASATIFDADILGYFMDGGENKEAGNLGFHAFAANPEAKAPTPNVWIWSLAMNSAGKQKDAAWYFMQWASSTEHDMFGARKMDFVNPVRASVAKDAGMARSRIDKSYAVISEQYRRLRAWLEDLLHRRSRCSSTSPPNGRRRCRRWWRRKCQVDEGLDQLAASINKQLRTRGSVDRRFIAPSRAMDRACRPSRATSIRGSPVSSSQVRSSRAPLARAPASDPAVGRPWSWRLLPKGAAVPPDLHALAAPIRRRKSNLLPYLLSLPALLVCIGILVPFGTAVYYSLLRFRLNLPAMKGFIWFGNYQAFLTDYAFWNTVRVSLEYTALTVGVELVFGLVIALLLQKPTRFNNLALHPASSAADDGAGAGRADVEADDEPKLRHPLLFCSALGRTGFQMGVEPIDGAVHRRAGRRLGLYAVHHDPAARRAALAAQAAVRGGGARRRAAALRFLSHHAADADALYHDGLAVPAARRDPAIRHHLFDDPGRPGRHAARVPGARLSRLLPVHQCRPLGGAVDDPVGDHLCAVERVHQAMAEAARTRARTGMR